MVEFRGVAQRRGRRLHALSKPASEPRPPLDARLLGILAGAAAPVHALDDPNSALPKDQRKCVVTINKNVAKVARTQGKDICRCLKDGARGKLGMGDDVIENCLTADDKGKVSKAQAKLASKLAKECSGPVPGFGVDPAGIDPNSLAAAAIERELSLIHRIFGSDLDTVIAKDDPATAGCQLDVAKQAKKCFDTKWTV